LSAFRWSPGLSQSSPRPAEAGAPTGSSTGEFMKRSFWTTVVCVGLLTAVCGSAFFRPAKVEQPTPKPAAVVPTEPVVEPAPAKTNTERDHLLETIGSLTSAHYFQTYLNIGFVADGKAAGTYSEKDARRVLDSIMSLGNSLDRKLEGLDKIELT